MKKYVKKTTQFFKLFIPPILYAFIKKIFRYFKPKHAELFDGYSELFEKYFHKAINYGEYGMGLSTEYVCQNGVRNIISVDTNQEWCSIVKSKLSGECQANLSSIDLGDIVGGWGYPKDYSKRKNIDSYLNFIWSFKIKPDFVLIDGRFRVACFLKTYIEAKPDTTVIFDDYPIRYYYHVVEELIKPIEFNNRQAVFKVPKDRNFKFAQELLDDFKHVMK